ncbi:MAG: glycosyltransferase family 2 protein [Candidatus Omnitrophica bacterium]|nr:glycosyltransferase family 2 protein [Candidatus Omnitrophota bacterium]
MKLSIIIVNFNKKDCLRNLLDSINKNCKNITHEVIVVDNASSDKSQQMIKEYFPGVKLLAQDKNIGTCAAYNLAFEQSRGKYICLMNDDILIHENTMQVLMEFLDKNPAAGYAGPKNLDENNNVLKSANKFRNPGYDIFFSYKHLFSGFYRRLRPEKTSKEFPEVPVRVDWMAFSCLMIRRSIPEKIGLFDKDIIIWWDDPYIQLKIYRAGWLGYYVPGAKITHLYKIYGLSKEKPHSGDKVSSVDLLWIYSKYAYFRKFYGIPGLSIVKCSDFFIFMIYLLANFLKLVFMRKNKTAKWETNKWLGYFKCLFGIKARPTLI